MGKDSKEILDLKKYRAKQELKIKLLQVINGFKSTEEPDVILNNDDIINCLSQILERRTNN